MSTIRVDPSSPVPIFRQIAEGLRGAVAASVYRPGDLVPSVRQQALALLVNPNTVQRAYDELERDGLLVSRKGIGMAVADGAARAAARDAATDAQAALTITIESALAAGLTRDAIDARYAAAWRAAESSTTKRRGK